MQVGGYNANGYGMAYAERTKGRQEAETGQFAADYAAQTAGKAAGTASQKWDVTCSDSGLTLHGTDTEKGEEAVTAWANIAAGVSMTVYRPQGFDPQNPVYKVMMWDASGKETEYMVDISKVDPANCNVAEMYAYSAHLSSSGECPDALERFLMAQAHQKDSIANYGAKNLLDKTNWLKVVEEVMQMQYKAGNLKGYLDYKGFLGFLMRKSSERGGGPGENGENRVDAQIRVNTDGSRVLMMTRRIGGMATTTSVEISKPTTTSVEISKPDSLEGAAVE